MRAVHRPRRHPAAIALAVAVLFVACRGTGDAGSPTHAIALRVGARIWSNPTATGVPIAELAFGDRLTAGSEPAVADPADSTRQFARVWLTTGDTGWVATSDIVFGAEPAVVTRDVSLRAQADRSAPTGEVIPRLTPVAVSSAEEQWVFAISEGGRWSGWIPDGRLTYRTEDVGVAGLAARAAAAATPSEREGQLERMTKRPGFSRSTFAADVHVLLWDLRHTAMLSTPDSAPPVDALRLLRRLGSRLGLDRPERFADVASRSLRLQPDDLRRLETNWTPGCGDSCLRTMAGSVQPVLADSALIPFLVEAVRSAESVGYAVAQNALRALGAELEIAALRAAMDQARTDRAVATARTLHARGDSSAVWWLRRVLGDPDRLATLTRGDALQPLIDLAVELGFAAGATRFTVLDHSGILDTLSPSRVWNLVAETLHGSTPPDEETVKAIVSALERRPQHWVTLVNQFVGTPAMNDRDLRSDLSAVALRLLSADTETVRDLAPRADVYAWHSTGIFFAGQYPSAPLVSAVIATLADIPGVDSYQASKAFIRRQQLLVQLTGAASAPFLDFPSPENRERALEFWNTWWSRNGRRFRPVPEARGVLAVGTWRQQR